MMITTAILILLLLWLLGFSFHVAGGFIWLLLVVAVLVALWNVSIGPRRW